MITTTMATTGRILRMPRFDDVLRSPQLRPRFQPIVTLANSAGIPYGYESLARYRTDTPLANPELLFKYAEKKKRVPDLELACLTRSLATGAILTGGSKLFLNVHPAVFADSESLVVTIQKEAARNSISPGQLVVEITEQTSISNQEAAIAGIDELRALGVEFALDDVGVAYSHLALIDRIRPRYLKISQHFGTDFELDGTKQKIVKNILSLASDFGCDVILEGIEEQRTADAAHALGIRFGQGYLYSRPAEAIDLLLLQQQSPAN